MNIYELTTLANNGNPQPYFAYLNQTKQISDEMESDLEVHHQIAPNGCPMAYHTQCEGRAHNHPDNSWRDCLPYVHSDGRDTTVHMLCQSCAYSHDPLGLED